MSAERLLPRSLPIYLTALATVTVVVATATATFSQERSAPAPVKPSAARVGKATPPVPVVVAAAPTAASATTPPPAGEIYKVTGFRSARFGMTREQVLAAITQDFRLAPAAVQTIENSVEGTTALVASVGALDPSPGAATVTYIFGKTSRKLVHVNLVWSLPNDNTAVQRDLMVTAAIKLGNLFEKRNWTRGQMVTNVPAGANSVVLINARDESGGAIEVRVDGVSFRQDTGGKVVESPAPTGPSRLRIAYSQNPVKPDIARIEDSKF